MGIADLVPGVSGGSIAFVSGYYQTFLTSLHALFKTFFPSLLKLRWKKAFKDASFRFLFTLFSGIAIAAVTFSYLIHFLISDPVYKGYLYAVFLGLIAHSLLISSKHVSQWTVINSSFVVLGCAIGFCLYLFNFSPAFNFTQGFSGYVITGGFFAISAMILPGISGSYVLLLLGLYAPFIHSLSHLNSVQSWVFLGNLSIGMCAGFYLTTKAVSYLLKIHESQTFSFLIGLVIGSLFTLIQDLQFVSLHIIFQLLITVLSFFVFSFLKKIAYKDKIFL